MSLYTNLPRVLVFEDDQDFFRGSIEVPFVNLARFFRYDTRESLLKLGDAPRHVNGSYRVIIIDIDVHGEPGIKIIRKWMDSIPLYSSCIVITGKPRFNLDKIAKDNADFIQIRRYFRKDINFEKNMLRALNDLLHEGDSNEREWMRNQFRAYGALATEISMPTLDFDKQVGATVNAEGVSELPNQYTPESLLVLWGNEEQKKDPYTELIRDIRTKLHDLLSELELKESE